MSKHPMPATVQWTRKDSVTGEPLTRHVPIVPDANPPRVQITVSLVTYQRLVQWASVGRTIDQAVRLLEGVDDGWGAIDELMKLKPALDDCMFGCKNHWHSLPDKPTTSET